MHAPYCGEKKHHVVSTVGRGGQEGGLGGWMNSLSLLLGETDHGDKERVEPKLRRAWWWERAEEGWQPGRAISGRPIGSKSVMTCWIRSRAS